MNNMTSVIFLKTLLFILFYQVCSEGAEPYMKAEGNNVEIGFCFGVDYIVVYRSSADGDQLLGNSSASADTSIMPPADLHGRIHFSNYQHLLGLEIHHLTRTDSGIYRRECWKSQTLVSQHTHRLIVCEEEVGAEEITMREQDQGTELLCNSTSIGLEGTSVRWYLEMYPSYNLTVFFDSSMSLVPLVEELKGLVEVRNSGAALFLDKSMLRNSQHFYCLVIEGKDCLSFQNIYLPDRSEGKGVFASPGDRVVMHCPSGGSNQQWETPLGKIDSSITENDQMYTSHGEETGLFYLVIPAVSDKHTGDYSCISSLFEVEYILVLCPRKDATENVVFEGGDVSIDCDVGEEDFDRVQWYRLESAGEYGLIHDSEDDTVAVPEDLRGRLTLSESGTSLAISNLEPRDLGSYWCIAIEGTQMVYEDYNADDYDEDYSEEEEWYDTYKCIFKQETILSSRIALESPIDKPVSRNSEAEITAEQSSSSNVTVYAVVGGLACVLVAGVIVTAVIVKRRRVQTTPKQSVATSSTGKTTKKEIQLDVDPGCTEKLTRNDENA